ncbi:hypothetical protein ZIOFF_071783 [Zingiber officinale]|uniref:Uncharacterized protein n=1 Tax=Zingiber officinale TaxID=94328 RepID=A0A8J5CUX9_ZINOF|nr:hypothetical protein ZIOFF_071783 [Zingiber officinale]
MLCSVVCRNVAASSFGPRHLVVLLFSSYFVKAAPATISMVEHLVNSWGTTHDQKRECWSRLCCARSCVAMPLSPVLSDPAALWSFSSLLFSSYFVKAAPATISIAEQLVNSWGLSEAVASRTSKSLAHLKSIEKPDVILKFLISQGFHGSHLDSVVRMSSFTTAVHMGSYVLW